MKVVFLDVDGVLNNENFFKRAYLEKNVPIDETSLRCLKYLTDNTGAVIVLSSCWRLTIDVDENGKFSSMYKNQKELLKLFYKFEIPLYGITPYINSWREKEIIKYLEDHPEIDDYVILDDDEFDLQTLKGHLIKVNRHVGFNIDYAKMAVQKLNNKENYTKKLTLKK